jgi:predicted Zn finger-like uncharacterized protein
MLIVCPSCATSYLIDPASVGPAGRAVRCARCKKTWFAGAPEKVPEVIAAAEAQSEGRHRPEQPSRPDDIWAKGDNFGTEEQHSPPPDIAPLPPAEPPRAMTEIAAHENNVPEPVTIADAPSLVPPLEHSRMPDAAHARTHSHAELDNDEAETFTARRLRLKIRRERSRRSQKWIALVLVLIAFNVTLVFGRAEVVRYLPQTASLFAWMGLPVNLRNLEFTKVRISKETVDGVNTLVIEGTIVSTSNKATEVPRLRFAARNASGQEVYTWTALPGRSILGPGESLDFVSRLAAPAPDATDVMVRFFNAQDAAAAAK